MERSKSYNEVDWFKVSRSISEGGQSASVRRQALKMLDVLSDIGNNGEDRLYVNGRMDIDYGKVKDLRWLLLWGMGLPWGISEAEVRVKLIVEEDVNILLDALKLVSGLVSRSVLDRWEVPVEDMRRRMVEEHWGMVAGTYGWSVINGCDGFDYEELDRRARRAVEVGTPYISAQGMMVRDAYASCC